MWYIILTLEENMRVVLSLIFCFLLAASIFGQKKKIAAQPSAPAFKVSSIDGKTFNSEKLKGKIVVLNLWFVNCPNCITEIKLLNKLVAEYKDKDVVFIGLATDDKTKLESFLKKNPFNYNIVPKAIQTILSFGEPGKSGDINIAFPMHVVVDRDNKIVVRRSGIKGLDAVKAELKRQFETVSAKTE